MVGLVQAADLDKTVFTDPAGSRLIDASIEGLAIDEDKVNDLMMFRLAEYVGALMVHQRVKQVIDTHEFPHVVFRDPGDFVS